MCIRDRNTAMDLQKIGIGKKEFLISIVRQDFLKDCII